MCVSLGSWLRFRVFGSPLSALTNERRGARYSERSEPTSKRILGGRWASVMRNFVGACGFLVASPCSLSLLSSLACWAGWLTALRRRLLLLLLPHSLAAHTRRQRRRQLAAGLLAQLGWRSVDVAASGCPLGWRLVQCELAQESLALCVWICSDGAGRRASAISQHTTHTHKVTAARKVTHKTAAKNLLPTSLTQWGSQPLGRVRVSETAECNERRGWLCKPTTTGVLRELAVCLLRLSHALCAPPLLHRHYQHTTLRESVGLAQQQASRPTGFPLPTNKWSGKRPLGSHVMFEIFNPHCSQARGAGLLADRRNSDACTVGWRPGWLAAWLTGLLGVQRKATHGVLRSDERTFWSSRSSKLAACGCKWIERRQATQETRLANDSKAETTEKAPSSRGLCRPHRTEAPAGSRDSLGSPVALRFSLLCLPFGFDCQQRLPKLGDGRAKNALAAAAPTARAWLLSGSLGETAASERFCFSPSTGLPRGVRRGGRAGVVVAAVALASALHSSSWMHREPIEARTSG